MALRIITWHNPGKKEIRTCPVCGNKFETPTRPSKNMGLKGRCCSHSCAGIYAIKKNGIGHRYKGGKIRRICVVCGKEFFVNLWRISGGRGKGICCSIKCAGIYWSKKYRGKDSPAYIDGRSFARNNERMRLMRLDEYKKWRSDVFNRDMHTCQLCNKTYNVKLQAHHILAYRKFPQFRLDLWNGTTLCAVCHKYVHTKRYMEEHKKWHAYA